jgi:hypothetical protein
MQNMVCTHGNLLLVLLLVPFSHKICLCFFSCLSSKGSRS